MKSLVVVIVYSLILAFAKPQEIAQDEGTDVVQSDSDDLKVD